MQNIIDTSHAFRLFPGQDLKVSIQQYANDHKIKAGWLITCVGSLTNYNIRFANAKEGSKGDGYFEIVSVTGTVSNTGSHLHICISDSNGKLTGGHLLEGCNIYTTAEIVLVESGKYIFTRDNDSSTEWKELQIKNR